MLENEIDSVLCDGTISETEREEKIMQLRAQISQFKMEEKNKENNL